MKTNINDRINHRANMVNKCKAYGLKANNVFDNSFDLAGNPMTSELMFYQFRKNSPVYYN